MFTCGVNNSVNLHRAKITDKQIQHKGVVKRIRMTLHVEEEALQAEEADYWLWSLVRESRIWGQNPSWSDDQGPGWTNGQDAHQGRSKVQSGGKIKTQRYRLYNVAEGHGSKPPAHLITTLPLILCVKPSVPHRFHWNLHPEWPKDMRMGLIFG